MQRARRPATWLARHEWRARARELSAVGRLWRRLGRDRSVDADLRSAVLQAITRTREQQARLSADAGAVFVHRAEAQRALNDQHQVLADAARQIDRARLLAEQAAAQARTGQGTDPVPYELTAEGLQSQLEVVEASMGQLDDLRIDAQTSVANAQVLLKQNAHSLDQALRAEILLLGRLERLQRRRVISELPRRRPGTPNN